MVGVRLVRELNTMYMHRGVTNAFMYMYFVVHTCNSSLFLSTSSHPYTSSLILMQAANFILFLDLSPEGRILWASPGVYEILGYEPEELVGMRGYDILYPEDHSEGKKYHKESFVHDLIASQMIVRNKAKDGLPCLCVANLCYDFFVTCTTILDPSTVSCKC
jgi:PAS domain-containing protein